MLRPKCPRCGSRRIRRGYERRAWYLRLFGIYHLLCDHCNWLFKAFSPLFTLRQKPTKQQ